MLREMKLEDAEKIREITASQLGYDAPLSLIIQQIQKIVSDKEKHFTLVYEDDVSEEVLGYVHTELYDSIYSEPMFNVLSLAVSKKTEKMGIGKLLMQAVETEAKKRNIFAIRLNSGETRIDAHKFYERIDYKNEKLQAKFIKILD